MECRQLAFVCAVVLSFQPLVSATQKEAAVHYASTTCGLEGFQFGVLSGPSYWSVTLDNNKCLIPLNYREANVTQCVLRFSVCDPLPSGQCPGRTNSSTCQEVTTDDGQKHYFDIGTCRGNGGYAPLGGDSVGFATIRQGETVESRLCNSTFETTLTWSCKEDADWDPSTNDATSFVKTATNGLSDCALQIEFDYSGACYVAPTLSPDTCQLPPYDTTDLTRQDYWYAIVPPEICYNTGTLECWVYFAFCQALPLSLASECYGAAVCQIGTNSEGEPYAYNMGRFSNNTHFVDNDQVVDGGFHMDVENGTIPEDGHCNNIGGIHTRVVLVCNASVKWTDPNISSIVRVIHIGTDPCYYVLEIPYSGACIPVGPTDSVPTDSGHIPSPSLGWILAGSLFLIMLVPT